MAWEIYLSYGIHENVNDDLKLFDSLDDFMYCEQKEI